MTDPQIAECWVACPCGMVVPTPAHWWSECPQCRRWLRVTATVTVLETAAQWQPTPTTR